MSDDKMAEVVFELLKVSRHMSPALGALWDEISTDSGPSPETPADGGEENQE